MGSDEALKLLEKSFGQFKAGSFSSVEGNGGFERRIFGKVLIPVSNIGEVGDEKDVFAFSNPIRQPGKEIGQSEFDFHAISCSIFPGEGKSRFRNVNPERFCPGKILREGNRDYPGTGSNVYHGIETVFPKLAQSLADEAFGFEPRNERPLIGTERKEKKFHASGTVGMGTKIFPVRHFQNF